MLKINEDVLIFNDIIDSIIDKSNKPCHYLYVKSDTNFKESDATSVGWNTKSYILSDNSKNNCGAYT